MSLKEYNLIRPEGSKPSLGLWMVKGKDNW